jgi:hypothetical protein
MPQRSYPLPILMAGSFMNDKFVEVSQYLAAELIGQKHHIINSGHPPRIL